MWRPRCDAPPSCTRGPALSRFAFNGFGVASRVAATREIARGTHGDGLEALKSNESGRSSARFADELSLRVSNVDERIVFRLAEVGRELRGF